MTDSIDPPTGPGRGGASALLAQIGPDLRIRAINDESRTLLGSPAPAVLGRPVREVLGEAMFAALEQPMRRALERAPGARAVTVTDAGRHLRCDLLPLGDGADREAGICLLIRETAARPRSADTVSATGAVAPPLVEAGHDLRQPVQAISLLASTLGDMPLSAEAVQLAARIERAADELQSKLSAVFDLSRRDAGLVAVHRETVELHAVVAEPAPSSTNPAPSPGTTILLVEDDATVRRSLAMRLRRWGFRVVECAAGAEVAEVVAAAPAPIDAAIVDYNLPEGQSGIEVIAALRQAFGVRSILLTGDLDPALDAKLRPMAATVLHKPVDAGALRRAVDDLITKTTTAAPGPGVPDGGDNQR